MAQETTYGIISDIHENHAIVPHVLDTLITNGAQKFILNGDICGIGKTLPERSDSAENLIALIAHKGSETYIQPGSHEHLFAYEPVVERVASRFPNLINAVANRKIEMPDHHLVFLPGSDVNITGGEYALCDGQIPTGRYFQSTKGLVQVDTWREAVPAFRRGTPLLHYQNIHDIAKTVTHPEKTILVCHVPRKFDNIEQGIDMAEFGHVDDTFELWYTENNKGALDETIVYRQSGSDVWQKLKQQGAKKILNTQRVQERSIFPIKSARALLTRRSNLPISLRKENRGNESLGRIYDKLGISKAVSSHFHESTHRACTHVGAQIPQDTYVRELYWNAGHGDRGHVGLL